MTDLAQKIAEEIVRQADHRFELRDGVDCRLLEEAIVSALRSERTRLLAEIREKMPKKDDDIEGWNHETLASTRGFNAALAAVNAVLDGLEKNA